MRQVDAVHLRRAVRLQVGETARQVIVQPGSRDAERSTLAVEEILIPDLPVGHSRSGGERVEVQLVALVKQAVDVQCYRPAGPTCVAVAEVIDGGRAGVSWSWRRVDLQVRGSRGGAGA